MTSARDVVTLVLALTIATLIAFRLSAVDTALNLPLQAVTPSLPCLPFQFHRECGTVSNPLMLAPGTYPVSVQVKVGNTMFRKEVAFSVTTCEFNPTVIVDLPWQLVQRSARDASGTGPR